MKILNLVNHYKDDVSVKPLNDFCRKHNIAFEISRYTQFTEKSNYKIHYYAYINGALFYDNCENRAGADKLLFLVSKCYDEINLQKPSYLTRALETIDSMTNVNGW